MCGTCGCSEPVVATKVVEVEQDIMAHNQQFAEQNRQLFSQQNVIAMNLVSSPGSGKTSLLEKTLPLLDINQAVIEGDQYTERDAERIRRCQVDAIQINTGKSCHLDAHQIGHAFEKLDLYNGILWVENVGNLICPALFDVGEQYRIVVLSVTEGDDKPIKYQEMFSQADCIIINKIDLLPYVDFNLDACKQTISQLSPNAAIFCLSVRSGEGMPEWLNWLKEIQARSAQL